MMKIAIIADTHLYTKFDRGTFNYLKDLFESHDRVIINGDLWDGHLCTFDKFIHSEWKNLFPIMQERSIYLYGNHDKEEWQDERNRIFCINALNTYTHELQNGKRVQIRHGHGDDPIEDFFAQYRIVIAAKRPFYQLFNMQEGLMIKLFGEKGVKLAFSGDREKRNKFLTVTSEDNGEDADIFVFSHTHLSRLDHSEKHINTGAIRFGLATYLRIEGNDMRIIKEKY